MKEKYKRKFWRCLSEEHTAEYFIYKHPVEYDLHWEIKGLKQALVPKIESN